MKDNDKTSHWVGNSKPKPLDLEDFYKIKIIMKELEDSLTGTTIEHTDYGMKDNPDLSIVSEVENTDPYLTTYAR